MFPSTHNSSCLVIKSSSINLTGAVNAVANKLLLKGGSRVEQDGVVELSLHELPADVRERLQALIDAKLAFNPKDLGKQ